MDIKITNLIKNIPDKTAHKRGSRTTQNYGNNKSMCYNKS